MTARLRILPADVAELLVRCHGVVDLATARRAGLEESRLRRLAAAGLLVRLAPGCYASAAVLAAASSWAGYRLRSRAFALFSGDSTILTSWSASDVGAADRWSGAGASDGDPAERHWSERPARSVR